MKTARAFEDHLFERGFLTSEQITGIRKKCAEKKSTFKQICLEFGHISDEDYAQAEAEFLEIPFTRLKELLAVDKSLLNLIPHNIVKQYGLVPFAKDKKNITVALFDPYNFMAQDAIRDNTKLEPKMTLSTEKEIWKAIGQIYSGRGIEDAAKAMRAKGVKPGQMQDDTFQVDFRKLAKGTAKVSPVIKLVDQAILQAVEDRASDIHIEPEDEFVRVRNRIDGVLIEVEQFPKELQNPIISRIKIMAKLDIAEHRKPQDGKIQMKVDQRDIDIRVSCYPTSYGENVVMRILDSKQSILSLDQLGFTKQMMRNFDALIHKPFGIILVTGPTGAGKTTTLYAALQAINDMDKNIMTIEDPIEYRIPLIRQSQVNVKAGLTFATGLRSLLRQDPDVMLIGEIRDTETAHIAIESSLTGHLVFATLHTNDAAGSISRILDMGTEAFLLSSSLAGIVAQRLVRTFCTECKKKVPVSQLHISDEALTLLKTIQQFESAETNGHAKDELQLTIAEGCEACKKTGYKGRMAIYELMMVDDKVRECIVKRTAATQIREYAFGPHNYSMKMNGFLKVLQGQTSVEEVLKVVQND